MFLLNLHQAKYVGNLGGGLSKNLFLKVDFLNSLFWSIFVIIILLYTTLPRMF